MSGFRRLNDRLTLSTDLASHPAMAGAAASAGAAFGQRWRPGDGTAREASLLDRVRADGKHLLCAGVPFRVKGATYGSFRPRSDGELFPEPEQIWRDLEQMAAVGLNTVRTYTLPPVELLDIAEELRLRVLVGLHYDDWRMVQGTSRGVHRTVRDAGFRAVDEALDRLGGRENVLAVSVGNEVPADLVRLHGIQPVESVLSAIVERLHNGDATMLATYSNFPTTEYLHIEGLDLTCFNVFLEDPARLRAYLRHLQIVAGETPLLITELGLASEVHGEQAQAEAMDWQLRVVDEVGCAGATVFSWTDEWGVAGEAVTGWGFGVTTADRTPKPALDVVRQWAGRGIRDLRDQWPSLSVVVCAYNEARLLDECLTSLAKLDYPGMEVIVCDDGSTDGTLQIAQSYPFRVLALPHAGLSNARNAGMVAASGEIVAYLDADAHCHPEWPYHLALSLEDEGVVATGGPNLPVVGAGFVERAVAKSPGGPVEVLVSDDRAEHVPGCNMAFVRSELQAIGGFDVVYTSAGDDVDVCWKLLDRGGQIAFAPAAQIRHHRRSTVKAYLKQQRGYGRSERMVSAHHPHRFNRLGQARWAGSIYGGLRKLPSVLRPVVYHGSLGMAPYQTVQHRPAEVMFGWLAALLPAVVPVAVAGLALAWLSLWWLALPALSGLVVAAYAGVIAAAAVPEAGEAQPVKWRALIAYLHVAQPFVRVWGRLRGPSGTGTPQLRSSDWTGDRASWLMSLEAALTARRVSARFNGPDAPHDVTATVGPWWRCGITTAIAWEWVPCSRRVLRPRMYMVATAAAIAGLTAVQGAFWGVALGIVFGSWILVERAVLARRVDEVITATTVSAR